MNRNLEPVKFYLETQLNGLRLNYDREQDLKLLNKKIINVQTTYEFEKEKEKDLHIHHQSEKGLSIDPDDINTITCFELATMISGNYLSNMFENNKNVSTNFTRTTYKFGVKTNFENSLELIYKYYEHIDHKVIFIPIERARYLIELIKEKDDIQFYFNLYKVTKVKFIFIFTYKSGDKFVFQKMMKNFFESHKGIFTLF